MPLCYLLMTTWVQHVWCEGETTFMHNRVNKYYKWKALIILWITHTTLNSHTAALLFLQYVCVCVCVCVCWRVCWYVWSLFCLMIHCCSFTNRQTALFLLSLSLFLYLSLSLSLSLSLYLSLSLSVSLSHELILLLARSFSQTSFSCTV